MINMQKEIEPVDINIGEEFNNQQIVNIFKCGNQGGMRRSLKKNCLILITDHTKSLYYDRIDSEGVLHYTGMGATGNQTLSYQNKTLNNSRNSDIKVFFFEKFGKESIYKFIGEVELIADPYKEKQFDKEGSLREVYVFPLKLINGEGFPSMASADFNEITESKERKVRKLSKNDLIKRVANLKRAPAETYRTVISKQYYRNEEVKEQARRRANGYCDLCGELGPFEKDQVPFLEVHHVKWLAKGGPDTIDNVVALCPNCHRKMHVLNRPADIKKLEEKAKAEISFS